MSEFRKDIEHAATTKTPSEFCNYSMERLQSELFFRKSWWSLHNTDGKAESLAALNMDPEAVSREYPAIADQDPIHGIGFQTPDQTVLLDAADLQGEKFNELRAWIDRHELAKAALSTRTSGVTGIAQGIGLYRGHADSMFSETDKQLLEALSQAMFDGLRTTREMALKQRLFTSWNNVNSIARVSQQGAILDMEKSFVDSLRANWPNWSGPKLPADLLAFLNTSDTNRWLRKKALLIAKTYEGDTTLLVMRQTERLGVLTPRQFEVAALYSEGHSTKGIAQTLSKELDTIKNHRKNIYSALGIASNNELSRFFREADPLSLNLSEGAQAPAAADCADS